MELTLAGVLTDLLKTKIPRAKIGIVVRGIRDISPMTIAVSLSDSLGTPLAIAAVGYPVNGTAPGLEIATSIEAAVAWRNQTSTYAGRILVFVPGEVDKLGSLSSLDTVTTRDVAIHLIRWAGTSLASNMPQQRFWAALDTTAATLPFSMLLDFVIAVAAQPQKPDAIPAQMWRLGLLEDNTLLNTQVNVIERLEHNRELITAIGQLSDKSRKRMNQVLRKSRGTQQHRLHAAARQLRLFFEQGERNLLAGLRFEDVEQLIEAGKIEPEPVTLPLPLDIDPVPAENDGVSTPLPLPRSPRERTLQGQELMEAIAGRVVSGRDKASVAAYVDRVRRQMQGEQEEEDDLIDDDALLPISKGRTIQTGVKKQTRTLRAFVGAFCTTEQWGGVTEADQHSLRDVVQRFSSAAGVNAFNPRVTTTDGQTLVGLLTNIDNQMADTGFVEAWQRMEAARAELVPHVDVLIADPIALLYSDDAARAALDRYLDAYSELLDRVHKHAAELHMHFRIAYQTILQGLLRLDVIFVATPGENSSDDRTWKAMLTPLHPLHLWRYRTILEKTGPQLSDEEQAQLTRALPKLPHLLHFVAINGGGLGKITLPQAGSLETLPIYENRTNRFLGNDGVEFLNDLLKSWLAFAPYSQQQIRIALVDVPYLPAAFRAVERFLRGRPQTSVVIDNYCTRAQNVLEHLAEMDFEGQDSATAELLLEGRLSLNLDRDCASLHDVAKRLQQRPVHLAYSFDQSSYDLTKTTRHNHLAVSPLVVIYEYTYDPAFNKGKIGPSSDARSGLFADYHFLVSQAIDLQEDQSFQVQIGGGNDVDALNTLLADQSARWLAVADRTMLGYAPQQAVPLVEQLEGRREVAVWAHATSRSVRQFVDILRNYSLLPDEAHIAGLMRQYGHIAAGGLFSAVRARNFTTQQREKQRKGLIGTVIAAHWYTSKYQGALIASLDSGLARQWLSLEAASRERADLIGLRQDGTGGLIIEIIEVKAVERSEKEVQSVTDPQTRFVSLKGPAITQLRMTISAIAPIFDMPEEQFGLFTHARREALKYQLYRECFRELHANADQYRWYQLLNAAFRVNPSVPYVRVTCRGIVVHTLFEEHGDTEEVVDSDGMLSLVRLRTKAIQDLVAPTGDRGTPPPPTTPPLANGPEPGTGRRPTDGAPSAGDRSPPANQEQPAPDTAPASGVAPINSAPQPPVTQLPQHGAPQPPDSHPQLSMPDLRTQQLDDQPPPRQIPDTAHQARAATSAPPYDVLLGDTNGSHQYGILGRAANKTLALDLNGTNTISLFGVQGGGKSYTVGSIVEMATRHISSINQLPSPLASIIFHYHESQDYPPEFVSMVAANTKGEEIHILAQEYGARPERLEDVLILTSADKVAQRQAEFPSVAVEPILFSSNELSFKDWRFLMGVVGNQMYMKQINLIMRQLREHMTLTTLRNEIDTSDLSDSQKALAHTRLNFASQFIDDSRQLAEVVRPGRLIIVDLRDEFVDKDEALGLFVVMLDIFANAGRAARFNKLVVFDEAHKYMNNEDLTSHIVDVIRQMRHQGVSILIASQDPPSLPNAIIELSSLVILHRFNSPKWLKHVQQSITALGDLTSAQLAALRPGEGFVWATKATDPTFSQRAVKVRFRPRVTQHGGGTKTAV